MSNQRQILGLLRGASLMDDAQYIALASHLNRAIKAGLDIADTFWKSFKPEEITEIKRHAETHFGLRF